MESSIIGTLLFFIFLSGGTYYLGYCHHEDLFAWQSQTSFLVVTFMLIPSLVIVLWLQSGAQNKLKETGFTPLPSIQNSVGISVGIGENPIWVFETTQNKDIALNFYRDKQNRKGWELVYDNSIMLIFNKVSKKMTVAVYEGRITNTLVFSLSSKIND